MIKDCICFTVLRKPYYCSMEDALERIDTLLDFDVIGTFRTYLEAASYIYYKLHDYLGTEYCVLVHVMDVPAYDYVNDALVRCMLSNYGHDPDMYYVL